MVQPFSVDWVIIRSLFACSNIGRSSAAPAEAFRQTGERRALVVVQC